MNLDGHKIAIIGLGYVGLPLAVEFGKLRAVVGFDIRQERITALENGVDETQEVSSNELTEAAHLSFTGDLDDLKSCSIFIVTVPTPVDEARRPDLEPLKKASKAVGSVMSKGAYVIYESTVYPGCTRDVCVPILETHSKLKFNEDFFVGYSPERINPGDKKHRLPDIMKVTSGSTEKASDEIDGLYASIVTAGTHKASSIEVAEAAKVIENTQRDLNIALMNELAVIFNLIGIDTHEVLTAAGTKWNFLPFTPGLVGGHCIGVDPYYLTFRAQQVGYHPEVILAGRRINDNMGEYVADQLAKLMMKKAIPVVGSKILVMGLTFKENCPDLRNTRVVDIITELKSYNADVDIWDPWISPEQADQEYGLQCFCTKPDTGIYDGIVIAVGHQEFKMLGIDKVRALGKKTAVIYDVKGIFDLGETDGRL